MAIILLIKFTLSSQFDCLIIQISPRFNFWQNRGNCWFQVFHEDKASTSGWYLNILGQTLRLTTLRTAFLCICPLLPIRILSGWCRSPFFCFWMMSCDYSIFFWSFFQLFLVYFVLFNGGWGNAFIYNIACLAVTIKWTVVLVFTVALVSRCYFFISYFFIVSFNNTR